ncbi:MAG: hypothetical protein AAGI30_04630 [Planctomycetota bacterium]
MSAWCLPGLATKRLPMMGTALLLTAGSVHADVTFDGPPVFQAEVGVWWKPFWDLTSDEAAKNWGNTRYDAVYVDQFGNEAVGQYSSFWIETIDDQIRQMKEAGFDFILSDLTNGFGAGGTATQLFAVRGTMPFAVALGGPLQRPVGFLPTEELDSLAQNEANLVWNNMAQLPNYVLRDGKPVLVTYMAYNLGIEKVPLPFWDDPRFTVERATGMLDADNENLDLSNYNNQWDSWWGWFSRTPIESPTEMSISPGFNTTHFRGNNGVSHDRRGGREYQDQWITAIEQDPDTIIVASWNDIGEECHIEPSRPSAQTSFDPAPGWLDLNGYQTDDFYVQLTRGYTALRENQLIEGFYYGQQDGPDIYLIEFGSFRYIGAVNQIRPRSAIIKLPNDLLTQIRLERTLTTVPGTCPGDLNGDDVGDSFDLAEFFSMATAVGSSPADTLFFIDAVTAGCP